MGWVRVHSRMNVIGGGYSVSRCTGRCAASGREFASGESVVAALVERDGGGLERLDYGLDSWDQGKRPEGVVFGFWRTAFTPDEKRANALLGDEELLDLFDDLAGAAEGKQAAFRYFLALLLVRRRQLRVVGTRAGAMLVLRKGEVGEPTEVSDPGLSDTVVAEAIEQLGQIVAAPGGGNGGGGQAVAG